MRLLLESALGLHSQFGGHVCGFEWSSSRKVGVGLSFLGVEIFVVLKVAYFVCGCIM